MSFFITMATPITIIQTFCLHMAIFVLLNYVFLILLFGPCMTLDIRRRLDGRADVLLFKTAAIPRPQSNVTSASVSGIDALPC